MKFEVWRAAQVVFRIGVMAVIGGVGAILMRMLMAVDLSERVTGVRTDAMRIFTDGQFCAKRELCIDIPSKRSTTSRTLLILSQNLSG